MKEHRERISGFDLLRGIAAFGIVGCHLLLKDRTHAGWLLTALCDMNVAVFAALSGYVMALDRWEGWTSYLRKRAIRILPTYLVWSVVFLCSSALFQFVAEGRVDPRYGDGGWWWTVVFFGAGATHLWFLITLFYAQVLTAPILRKRPGAHWILASAVLAEVASLSDNCYAVYQVRLLGFLLLGFGLASIDIGFLARNRMIVLLAAIGGIAAHFAEWPFAAAYLKDWVAVVPLLMAFAAWSGSLRGRWAGVSSFLGATSMGVYLIHPLFTKAFGLVVARFFRQPYGAGAVLFDWVMSYLAALVLTVLLLRLPRFARLVK